MAHIRSNVFRFSAYTYLKWLALETPFRVSNADANTSILQISVYNAVRSHHLYDD